MPQKENGKEFHEVPSLTEAVAGWSFLPLDWLFCHVIELNLLLKPILPDSFSFESSGDVLH